MSSGQDDVRLKPGHKVDGRWEVVRKLGEGSFGAVYEAIDSQGKIFGHKALKLESVQSREQVLKIEVAVLGGLAYSQHACRMHACGRNDRFNFMLMTLLGPSLAVLRRRTSHQRFGLCTSTYVTMQCVQALKDMHNAGWLHRDVKPSNFAVGNTAEEIRRTIFIFDFGLARYFHTAERKIREARSNVGFRGTLRYSSVNGHKGNELGRHDDLISLLYMMVEMVKGGLPWKTLDTNKDVSLSKEANAAKLYELLPPKLKGLHEYLHSLKYEEMPEYDMFQDVLTEVIQGKGYEPVNQLDWTQRSGGKVLTEDLPVQHSDVFGSMQKHASVEELPATGYVELLQNIFSKK